MVKPWLTEPYLFARVHYATGLPYAIKRNSAGGHLCGYVGVPFGHPLFRRPYEDPLVVEAFKRWPPHGGVTYADFLPLNCVPQMGTDWWWFGFDCGHPSDMLPFLDPTKGTYRDFDFVEDECLALARHLAKMPGKALDAGLPGLKGTDLEEVIP